MDNSQRSTNPFYWGLSLGLLLIIALTLTVMGRPWICPCGTLKLWQGDVFSSQVSQHLSDWYTFSHIIHGFLFFFLFRWLFPQKSLLFALVLSITVEGAWEIVENTDFVIEYYRNNTMSTQFYGDTILNSLSDILAMVLGFGIAAWLPTWGTLSLFVGFELLTIWVIRDSFLLNVLMLLYPIEAIKEWQMAPAALFTAPFF